MPRNHLGGGDLGHFTSITLTFDYVLAGLFCMESFREKVVVITGSATGIGKSLAKQFGKEGSRVVISGRRAHKVAEAVAELRGLGIDAIGKPCDVTKREEVEALADFAEQVFGTVDVIVNNAGISQDLIPILNMNIKDFRQVYEVNIFGALNGIQVFGKRFLKRGEPAAIYNVGSENSLFAGVPSAHAYVSSKHAIMAITELLSEETPDWLEVALIMPGYVDSEMTAEGFPGMDTDVYTSLVMQQLKAGEFYIVSHAYNRVRVDERYRKLIAAFEEYAPRYVGDDEFDVRTQIAMMVASRH